MEKVLISKSVDIITNSIKSFDGLKNYLDTGGLIENSTVFTEITYKDKPSRANLLVKPGQLIVARMHSTNKVLMIDEKNKDIVVSTGFLVLQPKKNWDAKFLYYYFRSNDFQEQKNKLSSGSTQKAINNGNFKSILIPNISYDDQVKIAGELDRTSRLLENREKSIRLLDEYIESLFSELIGNDGIPLWQELPLEQVCKEIYRYPTFYGFDYTRQGNPVIKIGNITKDGFVDPDLGKYDFIDDSVNSKYPRTKVKLGDILMAVRGDGSTVKRVGIVNDDNLVNGNISPNLIRFEADNNKVESWYLFKFITSRIGQKRFEKYITQTAKKTITAKDIKKVLIPIPPRIKQKEFVNKVLKANEIKSKMEHQVVEFKKYIKEFLNSNFNTAT